MMKVLARPTNNAEHFCGQRKERSFQCEHYKILRWFAWDFWLPQVQSLIICHLLQCRRTHFIL